MNEAKSNPEISEVQSNDSRRPRRVSKASPKKLTKLKSSKKDAGEKKLEQPYPVFDLSEAPREQGMAAVKSAGSGEASSQEGSKRKRRRKKGKGGASQNAAQSNMVEISFEPAEEASTEAAANPSRPVQHKRLKLDPESVAKFALKIYLAEVSEEGVALIGDNDAKELARRCFRLAEIFMEEQSRR